MRSLLAVLVSLTGCDAVFALGDLPTLDAASPGDGADGSTTDGAGGDGPSSGCAFSSDDFLIAGLWWSPSADLTSAVRYTGNGDVEYARVAGKTVTELVDADYAPVLPPPLGEFGTPDHPVLGPTGAEILVRMPRTGRSGNPYALGRSFRARNLWSAPAEISLADEDGRSFDLTIQHTLSGLTATNPRRMLIVGGGELRELIEGAAGGSWSVQRTYLPGALGVSSFGSGSLSPDGLRIVFTGRPAPTTTDRMYVATRASLADPFTQPAELYQSTFPPRAPYLEGACDELFFGSGAEVRRARR